MCGGGVLDHVVLKCIWDLHLNTFSSVDESVVLIQHTLGAVRW